MAGYHRELRELDAQISRRVFNVPVWFPYDNDDAPNEDERRAPFYDTPEAHDDLTGWDVPRYSSDMAAAWQVVERLRDLWTEATDRHFGGLPAPEQAVAARTFTPPFDDGVFFEVLHRHADRRWPWAFLYATPEVICRAALRALPGEEGDDDAV